MLKNGLLLMGGGARAAYQVGVLSGIKEILEPTYPKAFDIILGTSAGSINATILASHAKDWRSGVNRMEEIWTELESQDVYETKATQLISSGFQWVILFTLGWLIKKRPKSLLDINPLKISLNQLIDWKSINDSIECGYLDTLAVTASSYRQSGHWVFYQTKNQKDLYRNSNDGRHAFETRISIEHLLASCALPFIFPAQSLWNGHNHEYYGDGSIKQSSPLSPLIHLGAEKILVISCDSSQSKKFEANSYPSIGAIAGHSLSSMFYTALDTDLVQAQRINQAIDELDNVNKQKISFKKVDVLLIKPSFSIRDLAINYAKKIPKPIYLLLKVIGGTSGSGAEIISYLLFEKEFLRELIELGKKDAWAKKQELLNHFK